MGIERNFDVAFVAEMALREKQIQQNYRPVIAVHKWFARRPGTLFRALILSEFVDAPIEQTFFSSHDLRGIRIADPFMGGGTPLLERIESIVTSSGTISIRFDVTTSQNPLSRRPRLQLEAPRRSLSKSLASAPSMAPRLSNRNIFCAF